MRVPRKDAELDALNEERDHLAIQISLAADAQSPDAMRIAALRQKLAGIELKIEKYRPVTA